MSKGQRTNLVDMGIFTVSINSELALDFGDYLKDLAECYIGDMRQEYQDRVTELISKTYTLELKKELLVFILAGEYGSFEAINEMVFSMWTRKKRK